MVVMHELLLFLQSSILNRVSSFIIEHLYILLYALRFGCIIVITPESEVVGSLSQRREKRST